MKAFTFSSLLFMIFLVLKLCNIIDWSWWWVTAPLWINAIIYIILAIIATIIKMRDL